ncbi:rho guanine nucleotide exchange factor 17 [Astyanax mexicanus]|uniref:rho guanine nucleotide exchange factor 17 n=1 Tax=Astyanax mexicanus TaxID=7994 RepID=UPI0020CB09B0|nr:rho guanine nucleotide exchange factor 17 [Astyanax mexicanus]
MAGKETESKAAVYCSVSIKKLDSWTIISKSQDQQHHKSEDLESAAALPPQAVAAAGEKAQPSDGQSVAVARKVSKISAAFLPTTELNTASGLTVRLLSEKFSASHGSVLLGAKSSAFPRARSADPDPDQYQDLSISPVQHSGLLPEVPPTEADVSLGNTSPTQTNQTTQTIPTTKDHHYSARESVSGSDSSLDRGVPRRRARKSVDGTTAGVPAYKSNRRYRSSFDEAPHLHIDSTWPSVTKIRELFGDGTEKAQEKPQQQQLQPRKQHRSTSDADDLKSIAHHLHLQYLNQYASKEESSVDLSSSSSDLFHDSLQRGAWHDAYQEDSSDYGTDRLSGLPPADSALLSRKEKLCHSTFSTETCSHDDLSWQTELRRKQQQHQQQQQQSSDISNTCGGREGTQGCPARVGRVGRDPRPSPSPPTPPPRSSSAALPLSSHHSCAHHKQLEEQRQRATQPPDSLHSSHNSSKPHTGPSVEVEAASVRRRVSSGEEEEEEDESERRQTGRNSHLFALRSNGGLGTKYGAWAKPVRRSSGSEEDSPGSLAHHSRDIRRRSLRKKKKSSSSCSRDNGESDDSDEPQQPVATEHLERHQPQHQHQHLHQHHQSSDSHSQMEGHKPEGFQNRSRPCYGGPAWERGYPIQGSSIVQESYKRLYKASEGQVGSSHVPLVSRVSKVNIPSFLISPLGSRSSSRYSSTETLKEEDQPSNVSNASSSVLSKTFHGNATMYRSPSFGHGDNFSRAPVRVRPRLVPGLSPGDAVSGTTDNRLYRSSVVSDKQKDRISMSNPDIASDTLSLLSYLKTDLQELRMKKRKGCDGEEGLNYGFQGGHGTSPVYRMGSRTAPGLNTRRPSLKDLTATLRRAKSFTYSEKPLGRNCSGTGPAMRSSSEQRLDCDGDDGDRIVVSDREVESDDCRAGYGGYDEPMPTPLQDRYVQEARQVIRDICNMSAGKDDDDYNYEDDEGFKGKESSVLDEDGKEGDKMMKMIMKQHEKEDVQIVDTEKCKEQAERESAKCLLRGNSEENVFCDKLVDELSGHESSLTDEGIVTEPEAGGLSSGTDILGQTLTVWNQSGLYEEKAADMTPENSFSAPAPSVRTEYEAVAIGGDLNISKNINQTAVEAPSTPSALRRRRKFSSTGNNGSDSSNGSNGESNGESAYRSLSDPMPRRRSVAEDTGNGYSVDSNLLGSLSLNSKAGVGTDSSAADLSECTGSAASDLSVCSDSLRDYSNVIQSIVHEPGAMDKLIDEKANGKAVKKKSFSDPSRRGELTAPTLDVQKHPNEPINESEQPIPPSSSEPILSEQRDELWELNNEQRQPYSGRRPRSQSEHVLPSQLDRNRNTKADGDESGFSFDPKLAQVLSPCISRRSYKKRTHRVAHQHSCEEGDQLQEQQEENQSPEDRLALDDTASVLPQLPPPKIRPKHVRHASEPATFLPIAPSPSNQDHQQGSTFKPPELKHNQGEGTPSLEDVTEQYILALNPPEGSSDAPVSSAEEVVTEGSRSIPATPTTPSGPSVQRKSSVDLSPAPLKAKPRVDMRRHVVMTLLDTEQSYVDSLRTLIQGYMKPLKQPDNSPLCDPSLVDEMFYQIPEILEHHELFLEQVLICVNDWHDRQIIGQLLVQSFSKEILANIYSAYIDNFLNAKDAVRIAKEAKPAFMKFLEQNMRENKEKQALGDLMIKPVQRIPRYELLVKDLLKHTPEDHPDHPFLLDAQKNIKRLAEKINKGRRNAEEVERETRVMQEIEAHIEGVEHILNPQRKFLRQEMVMEAKSVGGKKDRSLFLFSDLLICTTLKRKSGSLRRSSMSLYTAASVIDTSSKYKFLWKLPLEDIELVKGSNQAANRDTIQKTISRLDEDLSTLGQISKLSETLSFPHQSLDDVIKDLMASVHRELAEKQSLAFSMTFLPTKLELTTASAESTFIFEFSSPDARSNFEQAFEEAKKKLAMNKDQWDPEFLKAIPIMKTRSGMQFSCASPSHSCPENTYEVWVCNSDGYVGQVCLLNIRDEPTVEACIAVCSARIICIAAVPGLKSRERGESRHSAPAAPSDPPSAPSAQPQLHISISGSSLELSEPPAAPVPELVPFDSDDTDDEDSPSPSSTLQSQASHSTISSSYGNDEAVVCKDMATETTSSEEEQEFPVSNTFGAQRLSAESPMDGRAMRRSSRGSFTRASLEDLLSIDPEAYQSSVWLGTEDGCIHVYQSSDNIRNRKNSMKMQHAASILCILYLDNKVFVSLANGEVIVYQREAGSFWDPQSSQTLGLGSPSGPVTKMVPVAGKLWCGCQNRVLIINTSTLAQEHSFQVGQDSSRCVTCMVSYGQGVWVALQGSAQVRLYHSTTYESITEVDVAPAVHKMLAGSDAIIRQHKAACLRITALLACRDVLWIGTSAGVVLTLSIPPVSSNVGAGSLRTPLLPMGSAHGHTGHVRFLTSIELPEGFDVSFPSQTEGSTTVNSAQSTLEVSSTVGLQRRDSAHRRASTLLQTKSSLLVISGGDGYEDFRLTSSSETVGRDDSTNHLLLWRV